MESVECDHQEVNSMSNFIDMMDEIKALWTSESVSDSTNTVMVTRRVLGFVYVHARAHYINI